MDGPRCRRSDAIGSDTAAVDRSGVDRKGHGAVDTGDGAGGGIICRCIGRQKDTEDGGSCREVQTAVLLRQQPRQPHELAVLFAAAAAAATAGAAAAAGAAVAATLQLKTEHNHKKKGSEMKNPNIGGLLCKNGHSASLNALPG